MILKTDNITMQFGGVTDNGIQYDHRRLYADQR